MQELTQYTYSNQNGFRDGSCFLRQEQDYTAFIACETFLKEGRKSILIWGDSHAAHLYPGYKAIFGERYNLIQRTTSGCPPILNLDIDIRTHCKRINDYVFDSMKENKPDKVVLAAKWTRYDWKKIEGTVLQLRKLGVTDIDLIGPVPKWLDGLPKQLFLAYKSDVFHRVPERMKTGLSQDVIQLDPILSKFADYLSINYISTYKILCNEKGCLTRLGETGDTLTAFDSGHLTNIGSNFVVSRFPQH